MNIQIIEASINDIDEIIKLKKQVWDKMKNKDWYVIDGTNKEFLAKQLKNNGLVLKAIYNNKIIGFLIVENNIQNTNPIIKLTNLENEIDNCMELLNVAVHQEYRGNHLWSLMAIKAEEMMVRKYNKKYILSTVHPDNIASMKSLLNIGYKVVCTTKMYGNKDRCILLKTIS